MRKITCISGAVGLLVAGALAVGSATAAQHKPARKLSYDEAWAVCKKFVEGGALSWDQTQQRYARGSTCMAKYGYRI